MSHTDLNAPFLSKMTVQTRRNAKYVNTSSQLDSESQSGAKKIKEALQLGVNKGAKHRKTTNTYGCFQK